MPVPAETSSVDALRIVCSSLSSGYHADKFETEEDLSFLADFLSSQSIATLTEAHDLLESPREELNESNHIQLCKDILRRCDDNAERDDRAEELLKIMDGPHFRSMIEAHDNVLFKTYTQRHILPPLSPTSDEMGATGGEPIRVIGLYKTSSEPLGITLSVDEENNVFIARILHGSMIDKQGLLHVGDIIKQVNGEVVHGNPDEILAKLKNTTGSITLHVVPSYRDSHGLCEIFVKAHFDYDATKDKKVPCDEVGLSFTKGDILAIVDQSDANCRRTQITPSHKSSRLIRCGGRLSRNKKRKVMYTAKTNAAFDRLNVPIYEEVAKMPPFERKTLVLIGAPRVGRRTLKNRLLADTSTFGSTLPHTSRPKKATEENGKGYYFVSRAEMQKDIDDGKFVEWGEYEGQLYGTKIDSVRNVMRTGKICILDLNPTALKILKTAEFMPFVVFVAAPPMDVLKKRNTTSFSGKKFTDQQLSETLEESQQLYDLYSHYFDLTMVNENFEDTYKKLKDEILSLSADTQWVPVNWVY
eukprot:gene17355-19089_t